MIIIVLTSEAFYSPSDIERGLFNHSYIVVSDRVKSTSPYSNTDISSGAYHVSAGAFYGLQKQPQQSQVQWTLLILAGSVVLQYTSCSSGRLVNH